MSAQDPIFRPLSVEEEEARQHALSEAERNAGTARITLQDVQRLYDEALARDAKDENTIFMIGVAFGEVLREHPALEWVHVEDEYGREMCLVAKGRKLTTSPISAIGKRLKGRIAADIDELRVLLLTRVQEIINASVAQPR